MSLAKVTRAFAASVISFTVLSTGSAEATPFENVFIFGDSIVDSGNRHISEGFTFAPPALGYFDGRLTGGPSLGDWFQFYAGADGGFGEASLTGGNNYSYAGARIRDNTNDLGPGTDDTPDLRAQVNSYLTSPGPAPGPNDLFIINAGGNDLRDLAFGVPDLPTVDAEIDPLNMFPPDLNGGLFIASAAQQLVDVIVDLEFSGVENILLMLPPDSARAPDTIAFANSPANPFTPEELLTLTRQGSEALRDTILLRLGLRDMSFASDLRTFDYLPFTDALISDPTLFGFADDLNVTTPCIGFMGENGAPDVDCSGFAFFDSIHPTSQVYEEIALAALGQTFGLPTEVSEPSSLALLGLGLAGFMAYRRRAA
ncbi:MAG: SGNH/GDSL hydrolase family protein [Pseudomonadota bacterium]